MAEKRKIWETLFSKVVHENPWWKVMKEIFVTPADTEGEYFVIHTNKTNKSVLLIVVEDGKIFLVRQYRYPIKKEMLEVPGGGVEKGSTPLESAASELRQELGFVAGKLTKVGEFYPWGSKTPELCTVVLAEDLEFVGQKLEGTELGLEVVKKEIKEVYRMLDNGEIQDGVTIAALTLARNHLLRK